MTKKTNKTPEITKCPPGFARGYEPFDKKQDLAGHFWDPGEDYAENEYEYDGSKGHLRVKNYDRRKHLDRVAKVEWIRHGNPAKTHEGRKYHKKNNKKGEDKR